MASMPQPQDHVAAQVLDQLPLKGPKPCPERRRVDIQDAADGHRTTKHHQRLGGIALARRGEPRCVAAQIKIGPVPKTPRRSVRKPSAKIAAMWAAAVT